MGGRWNSQGVAVAYLTESRALAALKILVHFGRDVALAWWSVIETDIPDEMIDRVCLRRLPAGWNDLESPAVCREFGADWIKKGKNLGILLPSAIIPVSLDRIAEVTLRKRGVCLSAVRRFHPPRYHCTITGVPTATFSKNFSDMW